MIELAIIRRKGDDNSDEMRLYKMFKMILNLYEKSLNRHKMSQESKKSSLKRVDSEASIKRTTTTDKIGSAVRERFEVLIRDKNLLGLWFNLCEVLNGLEEVFGKNEKIMEPAIDGIQPAIESFFIMYRILCDDEMIEKIRKKYQKGAQDLTKMPSISSLKMDEEESENTTKLLEAPFSELRKQDLDGNDLLVIMCERNKSVLNRIISADISLLNDTMSVLPKVKSPPKF